MNLRSITAIRPVFRGKSESEVDRTGGVSSKSDIVARAIPDLGSGFKKILVTTDFSTASRASFKTALDIAGLFGAKLYVLHVFEYAAQVALPDGTQLIDLQELLQDARNALKDLQKQACDAGLQCEVDIRDGVATEAIQDFITTEGIDLTIVYAATNNMGETSWVVRKDSPIKTIADLRGKKIGYIGPQSATEVASHLIMQRHGLLASVTFVPTGAQGGAETALDSGAVDTIPLSDPVLTQTANKYRVLFRVTQELPNFTNGVGVVKTAYAKANPTFTFKAGLVEGRAIDVKSIQELASLPAREEILAKVLFLIQASAQRLVTTLGGVGRNLAVVVDQAVKENKFSQ